MDKSFSHRYFALSRQYFEPHPDLGEIVREDEMRRVGETLDATGELRGADAAFYLAAEASAVTKNATYPNSFFLMFYTDEHEIVVTAKKVMRKKIENMSDSLDSGLISASQPPVLFLNCPACRYTINFTQPDDDERLYRHRPLPSENSGVLKFKPVECLDCRLTVVAVPLMGGGYAADIM